MTTAPETLTNSTETKGQTGSETVAESTPADERHEAEVGRRRRWPLIVGGAVVAAATVAGAAVVLSGSDDDASNESATVMNTSEARRTDLIAETSYSGTLGRIVGNPVTSLSQGTITAAAPAGSTVGNGDVVYELDGEPVVVFLGDVPAYRDLAASGEAVDVVTQAQGIVTALPDVGTVIEQGDVLYEVGGEPVVALYGTVPAYRDLGDESTNLVGDDVAQLEVALDALGLVSDGEMTVDDEFTGATAALVTELQEQIGAEANGVLALGEVVFIDGPTEVVAVPVGVGEALSGPAVVVQLAGTERTTGDDVAQLQEGLIAAGFDADGAVAADGEFDAATVTALRSFQESAGMQVDGSLALGEVVFLPEPIRVAGALAAPGTGVTVGAGVLSTTGEDTVVSMRLPAADQGTIEAGQSVRVELPSGEVVDATVDSVATVASVANDEAVFEVEVVLVDPSAATSLDEAPVDVLVVTDSVVNVVAVPVSALVVLSEGGYAVEVVDGSGIPHLVGVEPGFFSDGLVEVDGGVEPGDAVVVP